MIRSKVVIGIESSDLVSEKEQTFYAGGFTFDQVKWVAANYWETEKIINSHLEDKGLEVLTIEFGEDWDGENTVYTMEAKLMPLRNGEWTDGELEDMAKAEHDLHLFIEEIEAKENSRLYEEFEELAKEGELDEDEEHFTIWGITNEVKDWIEADDYDARQILDDAVHTDEGFQVVGWRWESNGDNYWVLTAELEY